MLCTSKCNLGTKKTTVNQHYVSTVTPLPAVPGLPHDHRAGTAVSLQLTLQHKYKNLNERLGEQ